MTDLELTHLAYIYKGHPYRVPQGPRLRLVTQGLVKYQGSPSGPQWGLSRSGLERLRECPELFVDKEPAGPVAPSPTAWERLLSQTFDPDSLRESEE